MTMTPEEKLAMARDDDTYAIGFQDGYEKAVQDSASQSAPLLRRKGYDERRSC